VTADDFSILLLTLRVAVISTLVATNRFGFMTIERDGARWTMTARDVSGQPMTRCIVDGRRADCVPAGWLPGAE